MELKDASVTDTRRLIISTGQRASRASPRKEKERNKAVRECLPLLDRVSLAKIAASSQLLQPQFLPLFLPPAWCSGGRRASPRPDIFTPFQKVGAGVPTAPIRGQLDW